jgi:excisionase family DNA binding protein
VTPAAAAIASRWITFEDAMEALQIKDDALRRLLKAGHVYGKKIGKEWRIDLQSIEAYLESDRTRLKLAMGKFRK